MAGGIGELKLAEAVLVAKRGAAWSMVAIDVDPIDEFVREPRDRDGAGYGVIGVRRVLGGIDEGTLRDGWRTGGQGEIATVMDEIVRIAEGDFGD